MEADAIKGILPEGWDFFCSKTVESRYPSYYSIDDLPVRPELGAYVRTKFPDGIYKHQRLALEKGLCGGNVCLTTGTASGKTLAFQLLGLQKILSAPGGAVLAVYPLKALGLQQEQRWKEFLQDAGIDKKVCRIDGSVPVKGRAALLKQTSVAICTPDILHAWMLPSLGERNVQDFLKRLKLIVVDEIHSYSGVFGSNAGFLFRRLLHAMELLGNEPQFIGASATIAKPEKHLENLIGKEFELVTEDDDSSPRHPISVDLLVPDPKTDFLSAVSELLQNIGKDAGNRFIAFVDSRKQVEYFASISARMEQESPEPESFGMDYLAKLDVLPYRAGYETSDRAIIQERLQRGTLRGVISTSALELGLDIPSLNVCVLVGVPRSSTSLWQRIGRVGRSGPGRAFIISTDSMLNSAFQRDPEQILERPLAESSLYLQNQRIQYIHALCLARPGGEHDIVCGSDENGENIALCSACSWPPGFEELCANERIGEISVELQSMKAEAGEDPQHVFPLRDVESQFQVQYKHGPEQRSMGSLSHSQLLRECYPGAVYYYATKPFRVCRILMRSKQVQVRKEKAYTTRPIVLPTQVYPNLSEDSDITMLQQGRMSLIECPLQIRQSVSGFKERRGPNQFDVNYGENLDLSIQFNQTRFTRHTFTSGILLSHPTLEAEGLDRNLLSSLLFEAFLMVVPFEQRDLGTGSDRFRKSWESFDEGDRFLVLYDDTYGSLKLSSRLMEPGVIETVIGQARSLYSSLPESADPSKKILNFLQEMEKDFAQPLMENGFSSSENLSGGQDLDESTVLVIRPGSVGVDLVRENELYHIETVFFSPRQQRMMYTGKFDHDQKQKVTDIVPIENIKPVDGLSEMGYYNLDTGQIEGMD